jgi:integrin beta 3
MDKPQTLADAIGVCLALGQQCLVEVRALARMPGPQGPQGPAGPAGRNAADIELFKDYIAQAIEAALKTAKFNSPDGGRTLHVTLASVTHAIKTATPLDAGVWREGMYQRGDTVSHGGSMWIAQQDTDTKPDTPDCHWRLSVKRGRDGKDGKPGERGAIGAKGERGERGF